MKLVYRISAVLFVVALLASPAMAEKKVRWKLAMTWSSTLTPFATAPMNLAKMVEEMSDGNFVIKVEGAEKHKAALGILDMTKGGQYEMGHSASYYWKGKDISTVFFCTVPFGMNVDEQNAWFYHGGGMELMQKTYDKFDVLSYPGGNTGVQMGGWFQKEINSLDDLQGLKMRIPGLAGEVFANFLYCSSGDIGIQGLTGEPLTHWIGSAPQWISKWDSIKSHRITTPGGTSQPQSCSSSSTKKRSRSCQKHTRPCWSLL